MFRLIKSIAKWRLNVAMLGNSMPKHVLSVSVAETQRLPFFRTSSPQQLARSGVVFLDYDLVGFLNRRHRRSVEARRQNFPINF